MKTFLKMSALLLLATSAFADPGLLLKREVSGGNAPPSMRGWSSQIVVYDNGDVYARHLANHDAAWEEYKLSTISPEILSYIKADLAELSAGEIVFDEEQPICYDLPSTSYVGVNAKGEEVAFAARSQCQDGSLKDFGNYWRLQGVLDGQLAFTSFLP